jgi:hypothetical protein
LGAHAAEAAEAREAVGIATREFDIERMSLEKEIATLRLSASIQAPPQPALPAAAVFSEPPPLSPWALERDRLRDAVKAAEDALARERETIVAERQELQELRERRAALSSAEDTTKVIYAKNIFSNLLNLAPDGPPEFEQLLAVLSTFFGVSSVSLESRKTRQQQSRAGFFNF